jgi:hypothetical protein
VVARDGFIYREIRVSNLLGGCSCKGQPATRFGCLLPALLSGAELFFVRVNRFWCVWARVLVSWMVTSGELARVFDNGLSDLWSGASREA